MKLLSAFFMLFLISSIPNKEIKLEKNQKVLGTFSGAINENSSFHLILTRNLETNKHNILAYILGEEGISEMPVIEFDNKFDFTSFHTNGDVITLITKTKMVNGTSVDVIDIDISNGIVTRSDQIFSTDDLKTVVRAENKNVLLYANESEVSTVTINSANDFKESFVITDDNNKVFITRLAEKSIDAIKTTEYTNDGSVSEFKAYLTDDELLVTQDNQYTGQIDILKMPTTADGQQFIKLQTFYQYSDKKYKKNSSYINDNKLFQLRVGKENIDLNIFDLDSKAVKIVDLTMSQVQEFSSDKEATLRYQKEALKSNNHPTVTVNAAANNSYLLKFNFENKKSYRYYDNWWWHHDWMWNQQLLHNQMIQQQHQQMLINLPKFGPNSNVPEYLLYTNTESNKNSSSFEIGIHSNGDLLLASELQTVFKEIDKKSYIEKLEDDKYLRHTSSAFTDNRYMYITYNSKSETFIIKSEPLD